MKDECGGVPIVEFCGLRSKLYAYRKENEKFDCKAKGIKKGVIKKQIRLEHYKNVLFNKDQLQHKMSSIRSQSHNVATYEINKVSLSCYDDKRYVLDDGIHTLA